MTKQVSTKVKIKPVGGKDRDAIEVFPVDAKEAVTAGTHEYVGKDLGVADWIDPSAKKTSKKGSKKAVEESEESEDEEGSEEESEEVDIENMGTAELNDFVKENKIKIKGFDALSLAKKREALTSYLNENSEEEI